MLTAITREQQQKLDYLMNKLTLELIKQLPKVELHCHLDGSLRVDTIIDLAKKI